MILKVFTLRDQKAEMFMTPIGMQTTGQLIRHLQDEMTKDDSILGKHAEDFSLYEIGTFNTETGELTGTPAKNVMQLQELKAKA